VREVKGNCDHVSHVSCSLAFDLSNMYCIQYVYEEQDEYSTSNTFPNSFRR
jgi:hypothetical protein